jgi:PTS system ascorbate-specific IIB component
MSEPLKIQTICGFGVGSSTLLKIKLTGIFNDLGIRADVFNGDLPTGPSVPCDAIFCSADIAENLEGKVKVPVVVINNFVNKKEMLDKVTDFLKSKGQL